MSKKNYGTSEGKIQIFSGSLKLFRMPEIKGKKEKNNVNILTRIVKAVMHDTMKFSLNTM